MSEIFEGVTEALTEARTCTHANARFLLGDGSGHGLYGN